jgi:hypothetical protein
MPQIQSEPSHVSLAVPEWVYPYRAGVVGGALGGLAMIVVAGLYGLLSGVGMWLPVNLIGATLVRSLQNLPLDRLAQFNSEALVIGLVLHAFLSITLGLIFAALLPTLPGSPVFWSVVIGPLLWTIASVMILPMINPAMAQHVDHLSFFVAHAVYSVVLGIQIARTPKVRA